MTVPSPGAGPSWSPHFQSIPRTTRVPTYQAEQNISGDKQDHYQIAADLSFLFKVLHTYKWYAEPMN